MQVETALRSIFDLSRIHIPFKMALAFGFLLYDPQTDSFQNFYINDHLSRDPEDRNVIHQMPNSWTIRNESDEHKVFKDIQSSDFLAQVRDVFAGQHYNFIIVRATHMSVQLFPMIDSNLYNDVRANRDDLLGHNFGSSDEEDNDDNESFDTETFEDEDPSRRNPFIDFEAYEKDGYDELISTIYDGESVLGDDDDTVMSSIPDSSQQSTEDNDVNDTTDDKETQEKLIISYLKAMSKQCRDVTNKQSNHSVLVSLSYLNTFSSSLRNKESKNNLCFFYHLAFWHLQCKNPTIVYGKSKGQEIKDLGDDYYKTYKHFYNISNDTNFRGVSLRLLPYSEYLFRTRINVFVVESLDKVTDNDDDTG